MPTRFHFEHRFCATSPAELFAIYFDDAHRDEQDRRVDIARRDITIDVDTPATRRRVSRVYPRRRLPALVRALVNGDLSFDETVEWIKAADRIDFEIVPQVLGGKTKIHATYQLRADAPGVVHRTYEGEVSVDVRLLSARIERAIIDELERSLAVSVVVTQEFLDRIPRQ